MTAMGITGEEAHVFCTLRQTVGLSREAGAREGVVSEVRPDGTGGLFAVLGYRLAEVLWRHHDGGCSPGARP